MSTATGTETVGLVQQFVERTGQLYSLPAAAAEVLHLTGEPTIDPRAIKACLESDPALAIRILRVVNSSLFGPSRQVTDLGQALTLLGIRPLKILVLGFSLPKELFEGLEADVLGAYWKHTLIKAVAAREFSERLWRVPGDEAFLAGLVQDIGVLALIQQLGKPYQTLLSQVHLQGGTLLVNELESLGFDHLVLSARLLAHWKLPPGLCAAISVPPETAQIDALSRDEKTLPQILHLAELVARLMEQPYGCALRDLLVAGEHYCELTYQQLQPLVTVLQEKVSDLASVLQLDLPEQQSYVDLLLTARERLADETMHASQQVLIEEKQLAALATQLQTEVAQAAQRRTNRKSPQEGIAASRECAGAIPASLKSGVTTQTTGLPAAGLTARLSASLQCARQHRTSLTLALFEVDRFSDLLVQLGPVEMGAVVNALSGVVGQWMGGYRALLVSDSQIAVICDDCARREAVENGRVALSRVKAWSRQMVTMRSELTLSVGLATLEFTPKNYPAEELIGGAERCLSAAKLSGGDTLKSIEF